MNNKSNHNDHRSNNVSILHKNQQQQRQQQHEEESSILATIGSTITAQSTYETEVLRDATLSQVPLLSGIGFPNLEALAPSFASNKHGAIASATTSSNPDISHMVSLFRKISNELDDIESSTSSSAKNAMEHKATNILRLKKQMLLSYFGSFTNLEKEDIGFDPSYDNKLESKRKDALLRNAKQNPSGNAIPKGMMIRRCDQDRNQIKRMDNNMMDAQRLEDIKQNNVELYEQQDNGLDKNNEQTEELQSKSKSSRKRSMMSWKRQMIQDQGGEWIDPEVLYQKRLERLKRRGERRREVTDLKISSCIANGNAADGNTDIDMEGQKQTKRRKFEVKTKAKKQNTNNRRTKCHRDRFSGILYDNTDENIPETKNETFSTESSTHDQIITVSCAMCGDNSIPVPNEYHHDIDSFLSIHMHSCMNGLEQNVSSRAKLRSSRRSNLRPTKQISYNEDSDNESMDDGNNIGVTADNSINSGGNREKKTFSSAHVQTLDSQQPALKSNSVNDYDIFDVDDSSDQGDTDDIPMSSTASSDVEQFQNNAVDDVDENDYEDRVDDWIAHGIGKMRIMMEQDAYEEKPGAVTFYGGLHIPAWVHDRLFSYQRTALRWMWELHLQGAGGIVGDEMGLGKTVQVCSYLGCMAASRKLRSVLIIAPASMLTHWLNELAIWAPGLRRILIHKSGEKGNSTSNRSVSFNMLRKLDRWLNQSRSERLNEPIDERDLQENDPNSFVGTGIAVLTTFEGIRRSVDDWVSYDWSYVVMDEGQKIRNPDADITIACKRLRTTNRLLLSGTPIQNDLRELWSLFDFVFPGRLGVLPTFLAEFADPIRRGGYSNASPMQVQLAYRCALVLRDLINPYLLRRQKKDIKEVSRMPGKTEQVLFCRLSKRQRRMYEAYLRSDEVQNILRNRGTTQSFRPIITLRKICNHPRLIVGSDPVAYDSFLRTGHIDSKSIDDYSSEDDDSMVDDITDEESIVDSSGKLEVLAKILPLWKQQGHRVLIFSQWKKTLDIIQHFINLMGWRFGRMDGNTNVASRQKLVDNFNNDDSLFGMLLTTKTGGVGLNLIGANRVVLFDPDWNPQSDAQARERAWRFGQKNSVTVYRLITAGTIEEKIYQRQIFKTAITNQVLQDPRQRRMFSQKDLRDLFTLKPEVGDIRSGDGVTETGELTGGRGVVNVDDVSDGETHGDDTTKNNRDNKDTLDEIMKSKGLAGVFDHDIVDKPFAKKSLTAQEMEKQAKKAAARAAKIVAESFKESKGFVPTWTGTEETNPRRFGGVTNKSIRNRLIPSSSGAAKCDEGFGGAKSAGINSTTSSGVASSSHLLAAFGERRQEIATTGRNHNLSCDDDKNVSLLKQIHAFIEQFQRQVGQGPATNELLKEFNDRKVDPAIFKSLLKEIAFFSKGQWCLK